MTQSINGTQPSPDGSLWGALLLGHGSQRGASWRECSCAWQNPGDTPPAWCRHCPNTPQGLAQAAAGLQQAIASQGGRVLLSCLEFIPPHPPEAVRQLAAQGIKEVVIVPYLLGQGKHATLELEEVLADLRKANSGLTLRLADLLGVDPRLADLIVQRINDLGKHVPIAPKPGQTAGVLIVKAGTKTQYDDCHWLEDLGQMVEQRLGRGYAVAIAQSHYGDPTIEAGAARLVQRGVSSIIAVPYLFFPGLILQRNVLGGMARLRQQYPNLALHVAPPLGVDTRLIGVAADRLRQARERKPARA